MKGSTDKSIKTVARFKKLMGCRFPGYGYQQISGKKQEK